MCPRCQVPVCAQHGVGPEGHCAICEAERRAAVHDAERRARERSRHNADGDTSKVFTASLWLTTNITEPLLRSLFVRGALRRFAAMSPVRIEAERTSKGPVRAS